MSRETYLSEKNKILLKLGEITKKNKIFVSLIFVGIIISIITLISDKRLTGMIIENIDLNTNKNLIIFVISILVIIVLFIVLRKKIFYYFKRLGEFINSIWSKIRKYPSSSILDLINKKVYSDSGDYIGLIKDIILGENKIDSLKIKLDKKYGAKVKGVIINWKQIVSCGEIVIIKQINFEN